MILDIILICIQVLESLLSFFFNSCIVLIHKERLRRGMRMNPSDLIQLVMGVTNITVTALLLVNIFGLWYPEYYLMNFYHTMVILVPFHLYFNFCLIAWLSAYYWTSITNLNVQMFVWVKSLLSSFMPHLLLLSALVSLAITLPSIWCLRIVVSGPNSTSSTVKVSLDGFNFIMLACGSICLSLSIILISLIITMSSLLKHVRNMKQNISGLSAPSVQAHVRAVRTMIFLLLLSAVISTADLIIFLPQPGFPQSIFLISWSLLAMFPSLEASIIIQSNPNLRKMFLQMFCAGKEMLRSPVKDY